MRLLNVKTLVLEDFGEDRTPPYAITSHRWIRPEITHKDFRKGRNTDTPGYKKIEAFCKFVRDQNESTGDQEQPRRCEYIWIDTCCIDKSSSAEVSRSINSMFRWYRGAEVCYAYLHDVGPSSAGTEAIMSAFAQSEWFRRGWTLQELIAPCQVVFLTNDWNVIGTVGKTPGWRNTEDLSRSVAEITSIPKEAFGSRNDFHLDMFPVTQRANWMQQRETEEVEDVAYCMFGVFGVNMTLRYGEFSKAWERLQRAVSEEHHINVSLPVPDILKRRESFMQRRKRETSISPDPQGHFRRDSNQASAPPSAASSPSQTALLPLLTGIEPISPPASATASPVQRRVSPAFFGRHNIDQSIDVYPTELGESLIRAAADGEISIVESLLRKGAPMNHQDRNGFTALHFAAINGFENVAVMLTGRGANINAQSLNFGTPLCLAALWGNQNLAHSLMARGARVNDAGRWVGTPLHCASWTGSVEMAELLLSRGADLMSQNTASAEVLGQQGDMDSPFSIRANQMQRRGSGTDHQIFDCQPFVIAAYRRHEALMDLFTRHRFPFNAKHRLWHTTSPETESFDHVSSENRCDNITTLMAASFKGPANILKMLLRHGAQLDERDSWDRFALWIAAQAGQFDCVRTLVEAGADIEATKSSSRQSALLVAVEAQRHDIVNYLAQAGGDVDRADSAGTTPCHAAAAHGDCKMLEILLAHNARYISQDRNGSTPLHLACARKEEDVSAIECLLRHDASPTTQDNTGKTALHHAAQNCNSRAVQLLLGRGASPWIPDKRGRRALDLLPSEADPTTRRRLSS